MVCLMDPAGISMMTTEPTEGLPLLFPGDDFFLPPLVIWKYCDLETRPLETTKTSPGDPGLSLGSSGDAEITVTEKAGWNC